MVDFSFRYIYKYCMRISDAIIYLKENGFILESTRFTGVEGKRYGRHIGLNHKSNVRSGRYNVRYEDDKRYTDYEGKRWLLIKNRDEETIYRAILDGMIDRLRNNPSDYSIDFETVDSYYRQAQNIDDIKRIIGSYFDIKSANRIYMFLKRYMGGETTVYRGFNFTFDQYDKLVGDNVINFNKDLLPLLNNRTKRFNSFSVSYKISRDFCYISNDEGYYFVIAAEVEPNDINWAFTAYLMGKHCGIYEYELNINNVKDLKNIRIVDDPEVEYHRNKAALPRVKDLQKQLDSGIPPEDIFDGVNRTHFKSLGIVIGQYLKHIVLLDKHNKIMTDFYEDFELFDDKYGIAIDFAKSYLYKLGYGPISKGYYSIQPSYYTTFCIAEFKNGTYQILDDKTGRELLPKPALCINSFPKSYKTKNSIFGRERIVEIIFSDCMTLFDSNGNNLLPDYRYIKQITYPDESEGIIKITYKDNSTVDYKYKNNKFYTL